MRSCEGGRWRIKVFAVVALLMVAAGDGGAKNLVPAMGTGSEPWDVAVPSPIIGSVPNESALNLWSFGAVPDDGQDDSDAFITACNRAGLVRRPLWIPSGTYEIDKNTTITCTGDLHLIGERDVYINLDGLLTFRADLADEAIALWADAPRGSRFITVDDTSHCSIGDLIAIGTTVVAEISWRTLKREVHRIAAVPDGKTLVFEEPLLFSYGTTDEGLAISAHKRRRITIGNIAFDVNDRQLATHYFSGGTVLYNCRWTERDVGEQDGYLYSPGSSIGVTVTDAVFEGGYYGCIPAGCRDVTFERVTGHRCAGHVIAPNNWCHGVYVRNIVGYECGSLVDSHPSFEVHYSNVRGNITGVPNLRSLGGSIRDYRVESTMSKPGEIYLQNIELQVNREIYDETTLLLEDFTLTTPNLDPRESGNRAIVAYGRQAVLRNVNWWWFDFHPGPDQDGPTNGFHEVQISDCHLACLSLWRGQQVTISSSHFRSIIDGGSRPDVALGVQAEARCSVSNTSFTDYDHAVFVPWTRTIDFADCRFADCGTVFAASGMAIEAVFNRCEFVNVGSWGDIDTGYLQVQECTFTPNDFSP